MRLCYYLAVWCCVLPLALSAQKKPSVGKSTYPTATPTTLAERQKSAATKAALRQQSIFRQYPMRAIGPCAPSGRIVDVAVDERNPRRYFAAFASGGVFLTTNNGQSFIPVFDGLARLTVGDIALSPAQPDLLWVGTGENNSSRSSYAGMGVYKSSNGGKTWQHCGLENTQHIGRIIAHPTDTATAWVAAIGSLYSTSSDRGVYKTTDGGKTWRKTLFVNDSTGVIELLINPRNPRQLWAASWQRIRAAWNFEENGAGSGLYYSEDGGDTWTRLSTGLPAAAATGRIGLDICATQPNTLYLVVDNQGTIKKNRPTPANNALTTRYKAADFVAMSNADFLALNDNDLDTFLLRNRFPAKYKARVVKDEVRRGKYTPKALSDYLKNANDDLFDTEIVGAEVYRSDDGGKAWRKVNTYALDGVFNTYGYYFGQVRVSPLNPERIYILGVPVLRSEDGGKTYASIAPYDKVHADHHALWINPKDDAHILLGNDGGVYVSYDAGDTYTHHNSLSVGQFYTVAVDMEKPYNVYGGLQDNGVWKGSSTSAPDDARAWEDIMGGDGMFVQVNPQNSQLVYTGFQFGNYYRLEGKERAKPITPRAGLGEASYRFNWRTPILLSRHQPDILYMAAQRVLRSLDRGDTWESISPDLTHNHPQGNVPYSTISALAESSLHFGWLYVGTDDGRVWSSRNGGATWEEHSKGLPAGRWVSAIFPSPHDDNTIFVSMNGYRFDELASYVFKSTDGGKTWSSIAANLPAEAVNVIAQDAMNPDLLYCGTDEGAYTSFDGGKEWHLLTGDMPNVAVYDLIVHPREQELIIATHGRGMYVLDAKPLQKLNAENRQKSLVAFAPSSIYNLPRNINAPRPAYLPKPEIKIPIMYYLPRVADAVSVSIKNDKGETIQSFKGNGEAGFRRMMWDGRNDKGELVKAGKYRAELSANGASESISLELKTP